jgi:hypothetical protein
MKKMMMMCDYVVMMMMMMITHCCSNNIRNYEDIISVWPYVEQINSTDCIFGKINRHVLGNIQPNIQPINWAGLQKRILMERNVMTQAMLR